MTAAAVPARPTARRIAVPWDRLAPTLAAGLLAAAYVIARPPSVDLAAHLFRAHLAAQEGPFGIWNNDWYGGHSTPGYSVLFPSVSAVLSPQLAGALAAVATAALFESLIARHHGPGGRLTAVLLGAATAIDLYTGRLALAFGALPALAAIVALDRRRPALACALAALSALCSPVAALFAALAAAGCGVGDLLTERRVAAAGLGLAVATAALAPIGALAVAFPQSGTEPFGLGTLLPVLAIIAGGGALATSPRLRAGIAVYGLATLAAFATPSAVGSNIARLGTFLAAPLAALLLRRHPRWLAALALPLLYVGWQAPVFDVATTAGDPSIRAAYYAPLLRFLRAQPTVDRIEIPLTRSHWEAYWVGRQVPLARGWERQLDIAENPIFYRGRLTPAAYGRWLHENAIRFVALPDVPLDPSARAEAALVRRRLPFLRPVMRSAHWRVYAVAHPTPLVTGAAVLTGLGPDWVGLRAWAPGSAVVRVRFSPYWALSAPDGCVAPDGPFTRVTLGRPEALRLVVRFAVSRIGATTPRCAGPS